MAKDKGMAHKIAPIATSVAVAAGVVAVGAALADKDNREKMAKTARKGVEMMGGAMENIKDQSQVYTHQVRESKKKGTTKKAKK